MTRPKTVLSEIFTKNFLTGLTSFFAGKSTTTSRLEERAVISESESKALLDSSKLDWKARDKKIEGKDFTTVTSYSGKFLMGERNGVKVSAKMRARKYFSHGIGENDSSKMDSIFGNFGSLELKISNVASVDADGFTVFPNSVFKPRIFISDDLLKKISKLSYEKLLNEEMRKSIIDELYYYQVKVDFEGVMQDKQLNPNLAQIEEFLTAITLLLGENPNLFEVQTVVAYNRDSYSAFVGKGTEYQYTLDRNIRIYEPDSSLNASNIQSYLDKTPLHKVEEGVAFAELKSPLIEKTENTRTYQELSYALFSKHKTSFVKGKGKHSLGSRMRNTIAQTTLSEQLHTEGLLFYLIKGVGNMPTTPKKNDLSSQSSWSIALPLEIAGEGHRLIADYGSLGTDGVRGGILMGIKLVDSLGRKIQLDANGTKEIVNRLVEDLEPSTITIDNQALTVPGRIDPETLKEFKTFFGHFDITPDKTEVRSREIDELNTIENKTQLETFTRKMKIWNNVKFLIYQIKKYTPTAVIVSALTLAITYGASNYLKPPKQLYKNIQELTVENSLNFVINGEDFKSGLIGHVLPDGSIQILPIEPSTTNTSPSLNIDIKAINGIEVNSESAQSPGRIILNQR